MNNNKKKLSLTLLLLIGLIFFTSGTWLFFQNYSFSQSANSTSGTVIGYNSSIRVNTRVNVYYPVINFITGSQKIISFQSQTGSKPPAYKIGQKVPISYQRNNPQNAKIDSFFEQWVFPVPFVIVGLFCLVIFIRLFSFERNHRIILFICFGLGLSGISWILLNLTKTPTTRSQNIPELTVSPTTSQISTITLSPTRKRDMQIVSTQTKTSPKLEYYIKIQLDNENTLNSTNQPYLSFHWNSNFNLASAWAYLKDENGNTVNSKQLTRRVNSGEDSFDLVKLQLNEGKYKIEICDWDNNSFSGVTEICGSSMNFLFQNPTSTPKETPDPRMPYIQKISPISGKIGSILSITGNNLAGFEGDIDFYFQRSDGQKIIITKNYLATGEVQEAQTIEITVKEPCSEGETVYSRASGIASICNFVAFTPGTYQVWAEPWGNGTKSNSVTFTIQN